jgi:hypothetical protein
LRMLMRQAIGEVRQGGNGACSMASPH